MSDVAARVMSLAFDGDTDAALTLAHSLLDDPEALARTTPDERAGLWYATANAELTRGSLPATLAATERCVGAGTEAGSAGWQANGRSMHALALIRLARMEAALLTLAAAEVDLASCDDPALRCWAHTGIGYAYLEMRLYEIAQPHFERALELDASPMPYREAPVVDLMNLCELHLRWADELERVRPYDGSGDDVRVHRAQAHAYALRGLDISRELALPTLSAVCGAIELCSRPRDAAEESLPELREAFAREDQPEYQGGRAVVGGALARALWNLGERDEAVEVAQQAATYAHTAGDWQVTASAGWLLVEMEAQAGVPGAASGRSYAELLSRVLWQQRLSTLQGAQAALSVERLHRDRASALQAASEDPLTGIGNRRAFDDALVALAAEASAAGVAGAAGAPLVDESPLSLLVVDLDEFKAINDTHGHVTGDAVLRAVATAIRGVARSDDLVARLGGDEFVLLARGADAATGLRLAERVTAAVEALQIPSPHGTVGLRASVGVATAFPTEDLAALMEAADAAMYEVKAEHRVGDAVG